MRWWITLLVAAFVAMLAAVAYAEDNPVPESIEELIRRIAAEEGADPNLAVAVARQESTLNPNAIGDGGHSVGLFQLHDRGMGAGMGDARYNPETNARVALRSLAQTAARRPDLAHNPGALAAASQRPADPVGYARAINGLLGQTTGLFANTGEQNMTASLRSEPDDPLGLTPTVPAPTTPSGSGGEPAGSGRTNPLIEGARKAAKKAADEVDKWKAEKDRQQRVLDKLLAGDAAQMLDSREQIAATREAVRHANAQIEHYQNVQRQQETTADREQSRIDAAAEKTPPVSSQYLTPSAADKYILQRNPDGTIKMKPDGVTPETILNPSYQAPREPREPRQPFYHYQDAAGNDYTFDPNTGRATPLPGGAKPPHVVSQAGRAIGIDPLTGAVQFTTDIRTEEERQAAQLEALTRTQAYTIATTARDEISAALALPDGQTRDDALQAAVQKWTALSGPEGGLRLLELGRQQAELVLRQQQEQRLRVELANEMTSNIAGTAALRAGQGPVSHLGGVQPQMPSVPGNQNEPIGVRVLKQLLGPQAFTLGAATTTAASPSPPVPPSAAPPQGVTTAPTQPPPLAQTPGPVQTAPSPIAQAAALVPLPEATAPPPEAAPTTPSTQSEPPAEPYQVPNTIQELLRQLDLVGMK